MRGDGPPGHYGETNKPADQPPRHLAGRIFGSGFHVHTFDALQFRDFRLLWLGQAGNGLGQWMDQVARGWLMYQLTDSPLQLGAVSAIRAVPILFFSVVAGVLADRYGRKTQLIVAQVINAVINFLLAGLVLTGNVHPWHVYATGLLAGIVMAFQLPARQSLVPELVDRAHLTNAIGLNSVVFNVSRTLGPAIAGLLIAGIGVGESYIAQGLLYAISTVWTLQMREPGKSRPTAEEGAPRRHPSMWSGVRDGAAYVRRDPIIRAVLVLALVPALLGQPYGSLMPVFARDVLAVGASGQGLLFTATGIGALFGALAIASVGNIRRRGLIMFVGAICFGLGLTVFAGSHWFVLSIAMMAICGIMNVSFGTLANTIVQSYTPSELRGRVMGIYLLDRGLVPLGSLFAGALASAIGAQWTVAAMGISCTLVAASLALAAPTLRELD